MKKNRRHQSRKNREQEVRSEQILPRERREKICSLLDDVIANAERAKGECLKNRPREEVICEYGWERLDECISEIIYVILSRD